MAKRSKPTGWTCYTPTLLLTLATLSVIVVVAMANEVESSQRLQVREGTVWHFECVENQCVKLPIREETVDPIGLNQCRATCNHTVGIDIWPMPTGFSETGGIVRMTQINSNALQFRAVNVNTGNDFWAVNQQRLYQQVRAKWSNNTEPLGNANGHAVHIDLDVASNDLQLKVNVDQTYTLSVNLVSNDIVVRIEANTIFGARHAIESLSQLIIYDDVTDRLMIRYEITFSDGPAYQHRGISLDTSRNYIKVDTIKRLIDGLAMVKMNVFHWHITDSHSFPLVIKSHPYLHEYGAYSRAQVYTADDVKDIVRFAYNRGVVVVPEFDAPAHVGEGWQFTNLTTCFNIQPWGSYCQQAPCGQFDPTQDRLYDILEDIYREMLDMFGNPERFHMGGDEVSLSCWATSDSVKEWMIERGWGLETEDYMRLWDYFQTEAVRRLDAAAVIRAEKIILWTSTLTEDPFLQYLDPSRYIIQVWTRRGDPAIENLLSKGFELIMSNYDVLYLDCGYESWTGLGNNWCSPYHGWHAIYNQDYKLMGGAYSSGIIGAESPMWTEQADDQTLVGRIFPRGIALAERLWSDPSTDFRAAEPRILLQRERFVENGFRAEALQPEWCRQNEGQCPYW